MQSTLSPKLFWDVLTLRFQPGSGSMSASQSRVVLLGGSGRLSQDLGSGTYTFRV